MGLARAANLPVVLVGDIDRAGLLAHLFGTVGVVRPPIRRSSLASSSYSSVVCTLHLSTPRQRLQQLAELDLVAHLRGAALHRRSAARRRGHPRLVVVNPGPGRAAAPAGLPAVAGGGRAVHPADLQLHRYRGAAANPARRCAGSPTPPTWPTSTSSCSPGSKATVADLRWLRQRGLAHAVTTHAEAGRAVLGIRRFPDAVPDHRRLGRDRCGQVDGLALLDADIVFEPEAPRRCNFRSDRLRD